jgi:hypothetical protein
MKEELWVINANGEKYNLSNPDQARRWLKHELIYGKKIETLSSNTGNLYSIDNCPDHLLVDFCSSLAREIGIIRNGKLTQ